MNTSKFLAQAAADRELLRKELTRLSQRSEIAVSEKEMAKYSVAMCEVYRTLYGDNLCDFTFTEEDIDEDEYDEPIKTISEKELRTAVGKLSDFFNRNNSGRQLLNPIKDCLLSDFISSALLM